MMYLVMVALQTLAATSFISVLFKDIKLNDNMIIATKSA